MLKKNQILEYILKSVREIMPHGVDTDDKLLLNKDINSLDIDSLELIEFIMAMEEKYNIRLKDTEIEAMTTVNIMIETICKKLEID